MQVIPVTELKPGEVVRVAEGQPKVLVKSIQKVGSMLQIRAFGTTDKWYVHPSAFVEAEPLSFIVVN